MYHNNKFVAALSKKDSSFGAIIETYNLKVYAEDDFIYLRKPANLVCVQALCFWCILIFAFVYWITLIGEIGTKYYLKTGFVILIAIFDILLYKSSKFSIYYNEEEIELRYTFRKKVYTYEDVSEYKIYPSKMNNNMEMISITFSDDKTIIINQEYENYQNFSKILKEKAFTPYVECL